MSDDPLSKIRSAGRNLAAAGESRQAVAKALALRHINAQCDVGYRLISPCMTATHAPRRVAMMPSGAR